MFQHRVEKNGFRISPCRTPRWMEILPEPRAWGKFQQHKLMSLNRDVSLRLTLKLFQATVFPTAMFGLASLPLTQRSLHEVDVVQRRMLWSIVGWVRIPDEPSEITLQTKNQRMEHAVSLHPLPSWSKQCFVKQYRLATKIAWNQFSWAATAIAWMPWNDWVHNFSPHHPETKADRPKGGIRHSLRFHVNILVNEIGWRQLKAVTNG